MKTVFNYVETIFILLIDQAHKKFVTSIYKNSIRLNYGLLLALLFLAHNFFCGCSKKDSQKYIRNDKKLVDLCIQIMSVIKPQFFKAETIMTQEAHKSKTSYVALDVVKIKKLWSKYTKLKR